MPYVHLRRLQYNPLRQPSVLSTSIRDNVELRAKLKKKMTTLSVRSRHNVNGFTDLTFLRGNHLR